MLMMRIMRNTLRRYFLWTFPFVFGQENSVHFRSSSSMIGRLIAFGALIQIIGTRLPPPQW